MTSLLKIGGLSSIKTDTWPISDAVKFKVIRVCLSAHLHNLARMRMLWIISYFCRDHCDKKKKKKIISSDAYVQNSFGALPKPHNGEENTGKVCSRWKLKWNEEPYVSSFNNNDIIKLYTLKKSKYSLCEPNGGMALWESVSGYSSQLCLPQALWLCV